MTEADTTVLAIANAPITYQTIRAISKTEMVPRHLRGKPEAMLATILYGRELGIDPMTAMQEISMIDGSPSPSAQLLTGMVRNAGHRVRPKELTSEKAIAIGERIEDGEVVETFEFEFNMDMAKRAGLANKNNWKNYPEAMMWWRAVAQLCRILFPEVIVHLKYVSEELGDVDFSEAPMDSDGNVIVPDDETETKALAAEGSEVLTPEQIAEEFDGEVVEVVNDVTQADDRYPTTAEIFGGATAETETYDDPVDKAWRDIPILLGADPAEGTIEQIIEYLESLCTAMEVVELFPEQSLGRAIVRRQAAGDHEPRWGVGNLRLKADVQEFARTIHGFAIKTYDKHLKEEQNG